MVCDACFVLKLVLVVDATATEDILHGHGIGRMTHTDVAHLWLQRRSQV